MRFLILSILLLVVFNAAFAQISLSWEAQESGLEASLRGSSAVNENIAWISGSTGKFAYTRNAGKSWHAMTVPGADSLDFRDVHAFDDKTAYLMSAGTGTSTRIYKTNDGGKNWERQLTNPFPEGFYSSMGFWDKDNGIVFSDPVDGKLVVFTTDDGGVNWRQISPDVIPPAIDDEYAFAASGTCLITTGKSDVWIATGGAAARVFSSTNKGKSWQVTPTPIISGEASTGIFSLAFLDEHKGVMVGGNYQHPDSIGANIAFTEDGGNSWHLPRTNQAMPFRSCVGYIPYKDTVILLAVGRSGCSFSTDFGNSWQHFGEEGYYTFAFSNDGSCWAAGANGRVAKLIISE